MRGIVVSLKSKKTVVVRVAKVSRHPQLLKIIKRHKNFSCQLPDGIKVLSGQSVEIKQAAPFSARKSWLVTQVYD